MKHHSKKKLSLNPETIRQLDQNDLAIINGGYTTYIYCDRTQLNTCPPKTPDCPQ